MFGFVFGIVHLGIMLMSGLVWLICLVANVKIAQQKGRTLVLWIVLSVLFSWIALIFNVLLPDNMA